MSFPKSGRTWWSYFYAYYACYLLLGSDADTFIDSRLSSGGHVYRPLEHPELLDQLRANQSRLPEVRLGHYFEPRPYFAFHLVLDKIRAQRVVLLARDPRDVVVSYFHHLQQSAALDHDRGKPLPAADVDLSEFIRSETHGIRVIVEYLNQAAARGPETFPGFQILHYEDLCESPIATFTRALEFLGAEIDEHAVASAVGRTSFHNLQELEIERRAKKRPAIEANALRFRRGVPGSHRAELIATDVDYLNRVIDAHLDPTFSRYRTPPEDQDPGRASPAR